MPRDGTHTRTRLLDVAEELFARRGFHAVSIRDITKTARVDVSQVHYHYGSKEELLAAVIERRAAILNRARRDALGALQKAHHPAIPGAEEVLHSFIDPLLELSAHADAGWKNYFALVAQVNNSAEWAHRLMNQHFNECVQEFIDALRAALPGIPAADLYWGYHFLSGALTLTFAETGRIDVLSQGLCTSTDVKAIYARFPSFFAGGFARLLERAPARKSEAVTKHRAARRSPKRQAQSTAARSARRSLP
jgi:AcrR family transcriptional regulator